MIIGGQYYEVNIDELVVALRAMANAGELTEDQCLALVNAGLKGREVLTQKSQPDAVSILRELYSGTITVIEVRGNLSKDVIKDYLQNPDGILFLKVPNEPVGHLYIVVDNQVIFMILKSAYYDIGVIEINTFWEILERKGNLTKFHSSLGPSGSSMIKFESDAKFYAESNCRFAIQAFLHKAIQL